MLEHEAGQSLLKKLENLDRMVEVTVLRWPSKEL